MIKILAFSMFLLTLVSTSVAAQEANKCVDISDNDDKSLFDTPYLSQGTPLLSRFGFDFGDEDNHIKQILVWPGLPPGMIRLDFRDKEPNDQYPLSDDDYCFNVTHFNITDSRIRFVSRGLDLCDQGTCTVPVGVDVPSKDFVFVLVGFQLAFRGGDDNHIKEVALLENNGQLTVTFRDQKFDETLDDSFIWDIQFAFVPRDRFTQVGELSGTGARDTVIGTIPAGRAVLRGFRFVFEPAPDHHIQQISVRPNTTGSVFMVYRDHDPNDNAGGPDTFNWEYRWATIRLLTPPRGEIFDIPVIIQQ